jgi:hypothetical protein
MMQVIGKAEVEGGHLDGFEFRELPVGSAGLAERESYGRQRGAVAGALREGGCEIGRQAPFVLASS